MKLNDEMHIALIDASRKYLDKNTNKEKYRINILLASYIPYLYLFYEPTKHAGGKIDHITNTLKLVAKIIKNKKIKLNWKKKEKVIFWSEYYKKDLEIDNREIKKLEEAGYIVIKPTEYVGDYKNLIKHIKEGVFFHKIIKEFIQDYVSQIETNKKIEEEDVRRLITSKNCINQILSVVILKGPQVEWLERKKIEGYDVIRHMGDMSIINSSGNCIRKKILLHHANSIPYFGTYKPEIYKYCNLIVYRNLRSMKQEVEQDIKHKYIIKSRVKSCSEKKEIKYILFFPTDYNFTSEIDQNDDILKILDLILDLAIKQGLEPYICLKEKIDTFLFPRVIGNKKVNIKIIETRTAKKNDYLEKAISVVIPNEYKRISGIWDEVEGYNRAKIMARDNREIHYYTKVLGYNYSDFITLECINDLLNINKEIKISHAEENESKNYSFKKKNSLLGVINHYKNVK